MSRLVEVLAWWTGISLVIGAIFGGAHWLSYRYETGWREDDDASVS